MRSMSEIMGVIADGKINTKEEAAAFVKAEAAELAEFYKIPFDQARADLLSDIGYCTGYLDPAAADRIMDLFETEHPYFGRTHPSPEEALRMGMELGAKSLKKESENGL